MYAPSGITGIGTVGTDGVDITLGRHDGVWYVNDTAGNPEHRNGTPSLRPLIGFPTAFRTRGDVTAVLNTIPEARKIGPFVADIESLPAHTWKTTYSVTDFIRKMAKDDATAETLIGKMRAAYPDVDF